MKIVRHEKHRGKYVGFKNGINGDYECSMKQAKRPPACHAGSTYLGPLNGIGAFKDNTIDPATLGPEFINELCKSELLKEVLASGSGCGADITVILIGNALIINRNAACHRTSGENIFAQ